MPLEITTLAVGEEGDGPAWPRPTLIAGEEGGPAIQSASPLGSF